MSLHIIIAKNNYSQNIVDNKLIKTVISLGINYKKTQEFNLLNIGVKIPYCFNKSTFFEFTSLINN